MCGPSLLCLPSLAILNDGKIGCASLVKGGILPGNNLSGYFFSFYHHLFQQSLLAEASEDKSALCVCCAADAATDYSAPAPLGQSSDNF